MIAMVNISDRLFIMTILIMRRMNKLKRKLNKLGKKP